MNNTVSLKYLNDYSFTELENAVKDSVFSYEEEIEIFDKMEK